MSARRSSTARRATGAALVVIPWLAGAAWLTVTTVAWAGPHVMRSDGLAAVLLLAAAGLIGWAFTTWPRTDTDVRDTTQALAARTALRYEPSAHAAGPARSPQPIRPWENR